MRYFNQARWLNYFMLVYSIFYQRGVWKQKGESV
ncbi:MAG: hypothetical protein H6Q14_1617 [Bacteroidetes bacterium]|jgi:hypothetical protein|nr:hypothetical protein [Bacteroidota bacterium]